MKFPATVYTKTKSLLSNGAGAPLLLARLGAVSLAAYILSIFLPLFIPGVGREHFPPYLALPEGGFSLSSYYLIYILICFNALVLFGLYLAALRVVGGKAVAETPEASVFPQRFGGTAGLIFTFSVLFSLAMLINPLLLSTDIFDYIRHGRIFAVYGENPLTVPATYFPGDPFFNAGGWVGTGSVYGPLHVYVTAALTKIAGDGFTANFLLFKTFFIGLNLLNLALIWKIARRLKPGLENRAMLFYGWNPFILVLVAANAHNDILMLTLVLGGILCALYSRYLLGAILIVFAALVKFMALPILLVYGALAVRKQQSAAHGTVLGAAIAVASVLLTIICYLPLWEGSHTFYYLTTVGQKTNFTMSSLIRDFTAEHVEFSLSNTLVQFSLLAALGIYLVWHMVKIRDMDGLLSAAVGLSFLTPLVLFWFQPWYLTLVLGLVALSPSRIMYRTALLFSFSVMFFDSFWWHTPLSMDIQKPLRVMVVFGLPVAYLVYLKLREVLPGTFGRMVEWSLSGNGSAAVNGRSVSDPSLRRLASELAVLAVAAIVPMAVIVSASPQLRRLADLLVVKLQLLTNF